MHYPMKFTIKPSTPEALCRRRWPHQSTLNFLCVVALLALSSAAPAALNPAPDGGYTGENTAEGDDALFSLTGNGSKNTALGYHALHDLTFGTENTATGYLALENDNGNKNTATGSRAMSSNTDGVQNTANGASALSGNITGNLNVAIGMNAMLSNTGGSFNTALGAESLHNGTGSSNTATGYTALQSNTTGFSNTANGVGALLNNTTGGSNTAVGRDALISNTSGVFNIAVGSGALSANTGGGSNIALGSDALPANLTGFSNIGIGGEVLLNHTSGHDNIAFGYRAGDRLIDGHNNIYIANSGKPHESNKIRIGSNGTGVAHDAVFIAGISGTAIPNGVTVMVGNSGKLGVAASSARYKHDIKPMASASEAILSLKPVTFRYKEELDAEHIPQFGLIAEEVEKVDPSLVARDEDGKVFTVRYEAVNAMLLNEFLKQHNKVEEQQRQACEQEAKIAALTATVAQQQRDFETRLAEQEQKLRTTASQQQAELRAVSQRLEDQATLLTKVSHQVETQRAPSQLIADR